MCRQENPALVTTELLKDYDPARESNKDHPNLNLDELCITADGLSITRKCVRK